MNYDIKSIKNKMLVKYPFFGSVIADVKYEEDKSLGTAGTNGQIIYYNPDYLNCLSKEEQTFVFAHEVCHIAFNHILRSEGKDVNLWNIATDGVINQFLKRDGLKMPEGGVDIADALNYDAEQLYEKLLQEKQQNQENQQNSQEHQNQQNNSKSNNNQKNGNSQNSNNDQQSDGSQKQNSEKSQNGQDSNQISSNSKNNENSQSSEDSQEQSNKQNIKEHQSQQNNSKSNNNQKNDNSQNSKNNQQSADVNGSKENASQQDISDTKNSQQSDKQSKDSNNDDKKHKDVGHDTHSMWEETVKKHKEQEQNKEKKNNEINKKNKNSSEKDDFEKKQEELENMGEKKAFKKNLEDRKKQLEELKEAISKLASQAGSTSNEDVREIENIGISKPLIDWRYILREAIKYDVDWSYQNATIEDGVITPNLEEQPKPETEIVLDTSGSISDVLLRNFLRECKNILQQSRVKVGCFDTKFYGFHEIRTEQDIENMKFVGGGGTDFYVAINAFTRRVENKIIFTDGEAWMPNIPCDAIWIVFGQTKINPKGGKVIYITPEQLDKLYGFDFNDNVRKRVK